MPTLNKIRDDVNRLIVEKNFPLNTMRALWRITIEAAEAGDIYLKTGCMGYWNKETHKPVSDKEYELLKLTAYGVPVDGSGRPKVVSAIDAFLEELIDVIFFIVNSTHEVAPHANLDAVFDEKLAFNFRRPKRYGVASVTNLPTQGEGSANFRESDKALRND